MEYTIEKMRPEYWPQIIRIYQEYMKSSWIGRAGGLPSWGEWDRAFFRGLRLVAKQDGRVLGWTAAGPSHRFPNCRGLADASLFVTTKIRIQGVDRALREALDQEAEQAGVTILRVSDTAALRWQLFRDTALP